MHILSEYSSARYRHLESVQAEKRIFRKNNPFTEAGTTFPEENTEISPFVLMPPKQNSTHATENEDGNTTADNLQQGNPGQHQPTIYSKALAATCTSLQT